MCTLRQLRRLISVVVSAALTAAVMAQSAPVAATPPLGWNSWDSYGLTITEPQFRANVEILKNKLLPYGWQYAVIDEGWYFVNPDKRSTPEQLIYAVDANGRYVPVPARFPSAGHTATPASKLSGPLHGMVEQTSFVALGQWVHAQGLKFGIHIVRGIPRVSAENNLPIEGSTFRAQDAADTTDRCPWDPTNYGVKDNAAGQAWYDSLLKQYASWGVDLLKVDCIADHPYKLSEIQQLHRAIEKAGRPMVLSLSPGPTQLTHADEVASLANMWRISDDVWDNWQKAPGQTTEFPQSLKEQFARLAAWAPHAQPGTWPDADMLPLGELRPSPGDGRPRTSRLSLEEQRTLITLWGIARSPLILGANLALLNADTLALLTNRDLIRINQNATYSKEILNEHGLVAWRADLPGGEKAIALFNLSDNDMNFTRPLSDFGKDLAGRDWAVRNLWSGGVPVAGHEFAQRLAPHGCVLLMLQ